MPDPLSDDSIEESWYLVLGRRPPPRISMWDQITKEIQDIEDAHFLAHLTDLIGPLPPTRFEKIVDENLA